eukprot:gene5641-6510_t
MINTSFQYWKNRLLPWIRRELQTILQTDSVEILEDLVLSMLRRHDIKSEDMVTALSRFLFAKTELSIIEARQAEVAALNRTKRLRLLLDTPEPDWEGLSRAATEKLEETLHWLNDLLASIS